MSDPRKGCPHDFYARAEMKCLDCLAAEREAEYRRGVEDAARVVEEWSGGDWALGSLVVNIRALVATEGE